MIAGLKPYPRMKDSGVPWLGKVPEHWEVGTLRRRLRSYDGIKIGPFGSQLKLEQMSTSDYKVYGQANVIARDFARGTRFVDQTKFDELSSCEVRPGDLLVTMMGSSGRCARVPDKIATGIMDSHLLRLRTDASIDVNFAALVIDESPYVKDQILTAGKGSIMHGLNSGMVKDLVLGFPPVSEQAAIVRYLDHVDRRIQRYVRAKRKLIGLLEEQKQAIIHRAVTRGLDPNVRLKPSGVEWLGQVPEHWEITRLKFVAAKIVDCLHATPRYSERGAFPAIRTADISPGVVRLKSARRVDADEYERWTERLAPAEGDILYSREGERFGIAACVPSSVNLCISQRMMVFRIRPEHNSCFVMWLLNSSRVYSQATQDVMGATAPHVNVSTIRNYALALSPRSEQDTLVAHIDAVTGSLAPAIEAAYREIDFLREYRTRLIADVVTGKLDVREATTRLPQAKEIEESGTLYEAEVPAEELEESNEDLDVAPDTAEA